MSLLKTNNTDSFCTIISINYLPQAQVLIDSFLQFHKNTFFYLLITDIETTDIHESPYVIYLNVNDIEQYKDQLNKMRSYYDVVEYATSVKPFLLEYLLEKHENVTFVDPDTKFFSKFEVPIPKFPRPLLTPHRISTSLLLQNNDRIFLKYGVFNLGFISVNNSCTQFLDWWKKKLTIECTRYPIDEVFTDQKWINLVPAYFNCTILKDLNLNVAPWNLDERPLRKLNNEIIIQNSNLILFHFSQISPQLGSGKFNTLWKRKLVGLTQDSETLNNFIELTNNYSHELKNAKEAPMLKNFSKITSPYSKLHYVNRSFIRNNHFKSSKFYWRLLLKISLWLDKSYLFIFKLNVIQYLRQGLLEDFHAIKKYF